MSLHRLAFASCLLLAGCAPNSAGPPPSPQVAGALSIITACKAYGNALLVLVPQRRAGRMTVEQVATVDRLNTVVDPICLDPNPPTDVAGAVTKVTAAASEALLLWDAR